MATFADLGRVEAVRQLFEGTGYSPFGEPLFHMTKAGDAATTAAVTMLEGIDFDLVYFPLKHLGYKAVIAVTGELYAVLACPETLTVRLGISSKLDFEQTGELWGGIVAAAKEHGYKSLGLELQPSKNGLCISLAAGGRCGGQTCGARPRAQSKDLVCISGSLGAAYLGQRVLESEKQNFDRGSLQQDRIEKYKMLVGAYLKPEMAAGILHQLEDAEICPSFGYFINRGLADAVLRLRRDSGLGVKVYADKIPFEGGSFELGKEMDIDPVSAAMNGGDDFRLLFTIPILQMEKFRHDFQTFDIIGHLAQPEAGAVLVTPEGLEMPVSAQGWPAETKGE